VTTFQANNRAGAQSVSVPDITPEGVLMISNGLTVKETFGDVSRGGISLGELLVGASDGTNDAVAWTGIQEGVVSSSANFARFHTGTRVLDFRYPVSGGSTRVASATVTAFASQEVQLNWEDNALEDLPWVAVLALGASFTPPPPSSGGSMQVITY
jgi:hypothetical protein